MLLFSLMNLITKGNIDRMERKAISFQQRLQLLYTGGCEWQETDNVSQSFCVQLIIVYGRLFLVS